MVYLVEPHPAALEFLDVSDDECVKVLGVLFSEDVVLCDLCTDKETVAIFMCLNCRTMMCLACLPRERR